MALAVYAAFMACLVIWLSLHTGQTAVERFNLIPRAETKVQRPDYLMSTTIAPVSMSPSRLKFDAVQGVGRIAIIISELGLSDIATQRAILDLPPQITLSFSAYTDRLAFWLEQSRTAKHETLLSIPMEPQTFPKDDPGPKALMARNSTDDNMEMLRSLLLQGNGYVGLTNFLGSRFMTDSRNLEIFFQYLKDIGLLFVDGSFSTSSVAPKTAFDVNLPFIRSDVVIDETATDSAIRDKLKKLEEIASRQGYAVGLASPYPVTFAVLKEWSTTLKGKNLALAPISAVTEYSREQRQSP